MGHFLFTRSACSMIGYRHDNIVYLPVCVTVCIVGKRYILQQVSEQVNMKCLPRHITVQLSNPYKPTLTHTDPIPSNLRTPHL